MSHHNGSGFLSSGDTFNAVDMAEAEERTISGFQFQHVAVNATDGQDDA